MAARRSTRKHGNVPCEQDNWKFDSGVERRRYQELKLLILAGEITPGTLTHHQPFALHAKNRHDELEVVGEYRSDFFYIDSTGLHVVEDVKGQKRNTDLFSWKKRHMRIEYGITIQEIRYTRGGR